MDGGWDWDEESGRGKERILEEGKRVLEESKRGTEKMRKERRKENEIAKWRATKLIHSTAPSMLF